MLSHAGLLHRTLYIFRSFRWLCPFWGSTVPCFCDPVVMSSTTRWTFWPPFGEESHFLLRIRAESGFAFAVRVVALWTAHWPPALGCRVGPQLYVSCTRPLGRRQVAKWERLHHNVFKKPTAQAHYFVSLLHKWPWREVDLVDIRTHCRKKMEKQEQFPENQGQEMANQVWGRAEDTAATWGQRSITTSSKEWQTEQDGFVAAVVMWLFSWKKMWSTWFPLPLPSLRTWSEGNALFIYLFGCAGA